MFFVLVLSQSVLIFVYLYLFWFFDLIFVVFLLRNVCLCISDTNTKNFVFLFYFWIFLIFLFSCSITIKNFVLPCLEATFPGIPLIWSSQKVFILLETPKIFLGFSIGYSIAIRVILFNVLRYFFHPKISLFNQSMPCTIFPFIVLDLVVFLSFDFGVKMRKALSTLS